MLVLSHNLILHHHGDKVMFDSAQDNTPLIHHHDSNAPHNHDCDTKEQSKDGEHNHNGQTIPCHIHNQNTDVYVTNTSLPNITDIGKLQAIVLFSISFSDDFLDLQDIEHEYFEDNIPLSNLYYPEANQLRGPPVV